MIITCTHSSGHCTLVMSVGSDRKAKQLTQTQKVNSAMQQGRYGLWIAYNLVTNHNWVPY